MLDQEIRPRGERAAVAGVAAILLLLVTAATYLTLPSAVQADTMDLSGLIDRGAPAVPLYEPAADLYVMPGREY